MIKSVNFKLVTYFFAFCCLLSCDSFSKKSLSEDEEKVVQKFLINQWGDVKFTEFTGETIPYEFYLTFSLDGKKLKYKREENYFASFGNKNYLNEGEVNLLYDSKNNKILIELLDKKGKVFETCNINVQRENLILKLNEQIKLREILNTDINKRVKDDFNFEEWSLKGVFRSKISNMQQSEDLSTLRYSHIAISHYDNFEPLIIEGLFSLTKNETIYWKLTEVYSGPTSPKKVEVSSETPSSLADTVASDVVEIEEQ
jgi:hypothetical protein